ncbi:MAG: hypothetical protein ABJB86_18305 [Bacteroidota bacterium]
MKTFVLVAAIFIYASSHGQNKPVSNENFVNAVSKLVVDSTFSHYYLSAVAAPCSFKKFDYDEWYKYALKEDVPVYTLNELAKKSFLNNASLTWNQDELLHAFCIDEEKAKLILTQPVKRHVKNYDKEYGTDKVVYYFSQPSFTDDYQYAVIDMGFRCDDQQCGMGATFLFRQVNGVWKLAGRKLAWGN